MARSVGHTSLTATKTLVSEGTMNEWGMEHGRKARLPTCREKARRSQDEEARKPTKGSSEKIAPTERDTQREKYKGSPKK